MWRCCGNFHVVLSLSIELVACEEFKLGIVESPPLHFLEVIFAYLVQVAVVTFVQDFLMAISQALFQWLWRLWINRHKLEVPPTTIVMLIIDVFMRYELSDVRGTFTKNVSDLARSKSATSNRNTRKVLIALMDAFGRASRQSIAILHMALKFREELFLIAWAQVWESVLYLSHYLALFIFSRRCKFLRLVNAYSFGCIVPHGIQLDQLRCKCLTNFDRSWLWCNRWEFSLLLYNRRYFFFIIRKRSQRLLL